MTTLIEESSVIIEEFAPGHPNFRSKICRHWLKGYCNRGTICNFAHGFGEVKSKKQNNIRRPTSSELIHKMETGNDQGVVYNLMEDLVAGYEIIYKDGLSDVPENIEKLNIMVGSSSEDDDSGHIEV